MHAEEKRTQVYCSVEYRISNYDMANHELGKVNKNSAHDGMAEITQSASQTLLPHCGCSSAGFGEVIVGGGPAATCSASGA